MCLVMRFDRVASFAPPRNCSANSTPNGWKEEAAAESEILKKNYGQGSILRCHLSFSCGKPPHALKSATVEGHLVDVPSGSAAGGLS